MVGKSAVFGLPIEVLFRFSGIFAQLTCKVNMTGALKHIDRLPQCLSFCHTCLCLRSECLSNLHQHSLAYVLRHLDTPWVQLPMETTVLGRMTPPIEVYEKAAIEVFEMHPWNCSVLEADGHMEFRPVRVTCKSCSGSRNRTILTYGTAMCILHS
ncbi:hypothetical protein DFH29DRAFT_628799 [Suillus ampliporus]|nr:hypothetical protein DFH29DRAFT_628799 [Suillus ampliporus]